jgi:uncharacterized protein YdhG (YjbR/CyaY superfamily)
MKGATPENIDEYIASFPTETGQLLQAIRAAIHKAAPQAVETIKYAMPTFTLNGNLIHFAAYKSHIGIYPVPREEEAFRKSLTVYEGEKSTMRIPFDKPLPLPLISRIVKYNVKRNQLKSKRKK